MCSSGGENPRRGKADSPLGCAPCPGAAAWGEGETELPSRVASLSVRLGAMLAANAEVRLRSDWNVLIERELSSLPIRSGITSSAKLT